MTDGGWEDFWKRAVSLPRTLMSSDADVLNELGDDGEVDVGLEEGEADLAEGVGDVLVGDGALAAEGLEGTLEFVAEVFKHTALSLSV
jgi:hypothetical protein